MEFRSARHTDDLESIIEFYCGILNFDLLGRFQSHSNYDGVFIGKEGLDWHLEFTQSDEKANHQFDEDDILVFYPTSEEEYLDIVKRIQSANIQTIQAKNSYWNQNAIVIRDPDGYCVVFSRRKISS